MTATERPSDKGIAMGTLVHVYERKVWIESDIMGNRRVMVQHDAPGEEPFCYCTFGYDYRHTSNATQLREAERMALWLGAKEPVEHRTRTLDAAPADPINPPETDSKLIVPSADARIDGLIRVGDQFPRLFITTPDGVRKEIRRIEYMDLDQHGNDKYPAWTSSFAKEQSRGR